MISSLWAATAWTSAPVGLGKVEPIEPVCAHLKRLLSNLTKHSGSCPISPRTPSGQLTALVKTRLKRMQYRPGLLIDFRASSKLGFDPFCNTRP